MKTNIGIVGYGNLGKSVEQVILSNPNYNLVAIFSRRLVKSKFNTLVENYENITLYKNKIDIMLMCGGSFNDVEKQTQDTLKYFDCINTFDTHSKILNDLTKFDKLAKTSNHRLIMSCGWDPGLFSNFRALLFAISNEKPTVFWGKGISMGHSDAIRQVKNVEDGVEFTIPNKMAIKLAKQGKLSGQECLHLRECFVVANKKYHSVIEKEIKNIPNYFFGYPTSISFVSCDEILKLKSNMSHSGEIITNFKTVHGSKCFFDLKLQMSSNPNFTASVMACYIEAIENLKSIKQCGAYSPLDIPPIFLFKKEKRNKIIETLC